MNRLIFQMLGSTLIGLVICLAEHPEIIAQISLRAAGQMQTQTGGMTVDSTLLGEQIAEKMAGKNLLPLLESPEFRAVVDRLLGEVPEPATQPVQRQAGKPFDFQALMTEPPLTEQSPEIAGPTAQVKNVPARKNTTETARPNVDFGENEASGEAAWPSTIRRNEFVD